MWRAVKAFSYIASSSRDRTDLTANFSARPSIRVLLFGWGSRSILTDAGGPPRKRKTLAVADEGSWGKTYAAARSCRPAGKVVLDGSRRQRRGYAYRTGSDDPASSGTNSSRARSYIHFASAHSAARCLSVKTGTDRFDASKTLHVSSKKRRRGQRTCPLLFVGYFPCS